jgi:hypothetical protein
MSAAERPAIPQTPAPPPPPPPTAEDARGRRGDDPFRYGWRYERGPDGQATGKRIPLTLEDVLHPQEDDYHVQRPGHYDDVAYLYAVFKERFADRPRIVVTADLRYELDPDPDDKQGHGPDIAVVLNADQPSRWLGTWKVGMTGPLPDLIIEVVSPDTRVNDVERKRNEYFEAGVREYVVVDAAATETWFDLSLMPFRRGRAGYVPQPTDKRGRYYLDIPGVWLGAREGRVVCWDPVTDDEIGDYTEISRQLNAERQARAAAEKAKADAEKAKADAEKAKADAEKREAEHAAARLAAEERIRALEEQLRRMAGGA